MILFTIGITIGIIPITAGTTILITDITPAGTMDMAVTGIIPVAAAVEKRLPKDAIRKKPSGKLKKPR